MRYYLVCVRPQDETESYYWVKREQLMKPEDFRKWKANLDAAVEFNNDEFAQGHPECKDWRTNKGLPKRCY
jgi:hypothetical protein